MGEFYNVFFENKHSDFFANKLVCYNYNLLMYILKQRNDYGKKSSLSILEIGPGKGYFYKACIKFNQISNVQKLDYYAFDRNKLMLESLDLPEDKYFTGEAPDLSMIKNVKFDIVFCSYVAEHLRNGYEVYLLINNIKEIINKNGNIILLTPNACKQKFEFWNIDYTHIYPTTKRNVAMAFYDNNIFDLKVFDINGLIYHKFFYNKLLYFLSRIVLFFYNYKLFSFIFGWIYHKPLYSLDNFFYRVYCFIKEENLLFYANLK